MRGIAKRPGLEMFAAQKSVPCADLLPDEFLDVASHVFGIIVAGALACDAYYLMPYDGGCGVVLVNDQRLHTTEKHPALRIAATFPQAISTYPILDHRSAFTPYAESYGLQTNSVGAKVIVSAQNAEVLSAEFDKGNRLVKLDAISAPAK